MTTMPDWDFFRTYRQFGGWELVTPYLARVGVSDEDAHWVKSREKLRCGSQVCYILTGQGYTLLPEGSILYESTRLTGNVLRVVSKDDFEAFNFSTATKPELLALGEFMCGAPLHGQWFAELFVQMKAVLEHTQRGGNP